MKIILFIILFIVFIILSIIVFLLSNRDKIFYFLPKYIHNPQFEKFLKDYNGVKYKCKVDGVDIIDLPPRKNTNKVIVFFHGNYGNIQTRDRILSFLSDSFKCRIVSVDYLHGKEASINNILKITSSVIHELVENGVELDDMIIWGESIGCAMSLETIKLTRVNNFVMMAGFRRMRDMVEIILGGKLGIFAKKFVTELDNQKHLENNKDLNLIVLHSKDDDLIPFTQVKEMVNKLKLEFYEIEGTHNSPIIKQKIVEKIKNKFNI